MEKSKDESERGRYWCDEKGLILGTRGKGNVPRWGNVLAQKRDKKWCRKEGDERNGRQLIQLAKDKVYGDITTATRKGISVSCSMAT